jgi:hypothetical protein
MAKSTPKKGLKKLAKVIILGGQLRSIAIRLMERIVTFALDASRVGPAGRDAFVTRLLRSNGRTFLEL